MTSSFSWLDFDEPARQRMREIVELLREPGSIDELGLGRMRDAFSDRLFPGTSVLWRRARYLLFVAWTYQQLEREGCHRRSPEDAARFVQRKVRDAIHGTKDTTGLIGARTPNPMSPPDVILWAALSTWGVREHGAGTLSQYRSTLRAKPRRTDAEETPSSIWNPRIPPAPSRFPEEACFALRNREAAFLQDLILSEDAERDTDAGRRKDSLLADLLRVEHLHPVHFPWQHELSPAASPELREALHMSGCFSDVMHGASILYALSLAELRTEEERADEARKAMEAWAKRIADERPHELERWGADLDRFFLVVDAQRKTLATEQSFVRRFSALALRDPAALATSADAHQLVGEREAQAKGSKARLTSLRDDDRGDGGSIPGPLTYRWTNALNLAQDIRAGLET